MNLAASLLEEIKGGADFGELAAKHSVEPISKANGGKFRVFERGERDTLIKGLAFETPLGAVSEPLVTPLGVHILKRVDPTDFPPELWEDNFIQVSGILVSHLKALGVPEGLNRTQTEARAMVDDIVRRVKGGEDFNEIAARFNDDPGGKERRGHLGWIHRHNPDLPTFFGRLFLEKPGTLTEPALTPSGVVVLLRH
ncbi:UNVERIFIED_CONTAM: hypothetical protein GTU68_017820 [Idotea baltica]|nr:hypothetical protein [Idotea baltica]